VRTYHDESCEVQGISLIVIKSFASQLLQTLRFLQKLHVIHCDLKPENILLQHPAMSKIKVIDFGSSCFNHEKGTNQPFCLKFVCAFWEH
jgi:serine/threonine protein kinase